MGAPGHDADHAGRVDPGWKPAEVDDDTLSDRPNHRLVAKADNVKLLVDQKKVR